MATKLTTTNKKLYRVLREAGVSKNKAGRVLADLNGAATPRRSRKRISKLKRKVRQLRHHSKQN